MTSPALTDEELANIKARSGNLGLGSVHRLIAEVERLRSAPTICEWGGEFDVPPCDQPAASPIVFFGRPKVWLCQEHFGRGNFLATPEVVQELTAEVERLRGEAAVMAEELDRWSQRVTPDASLPLADVQYDPTTEARPLSIRVPPADVQRPTPPLTEESKGRIRLVGIAGYTDDGRPMLADWQTDGGEVGYHVDAYGPDDVVMAGWTFRELHAIANGTGPDVQRVRELDELPVVRRGPAPDWMGADWRG